MQTKKQSFIESLTNVAVGFSISFLSLTLIFPLLGIQSDPFKNIAITLYFTVLSIARSYFLRRFFNGKRQKNQQYIPPEHTYQNGCTNCKCCRNEQDIPLMGQHTINGVVPTGHNNL